MEQELTNSATRILDALNALKKESSSKKIIGFWKDYCGLDNNYEVFSVLAKFIEEVDSLKYEIESIQFQDLDKSYLIEEHKTLYGIFSQNNLSANIDGIQKSITDTLLLQLRMCKSVLEKHLYLKQINELKIEDELLNDILESSRQLLKDINECDINQDLKLQLIECCNAIIWSIKHYKCLGTKELKKAIIFSISSLSEHSEKMDEYKEHHFMKSFSYITKKSFEVLSYAAKVNSALHGLPSTLQEIYHSLPPSD